MTVALLKIILAFFDINQQKQ